MFFMLGEKVVPGAGSNNQNITLKSHKMLQCSKFTYHHMYQHTHIVPGFGAHYQPLRQSYEANRFFCAPVRVLLASILVGLDTLSQELCERRDARSNSGSFKCIRIISRD